MSVCIFIGRKHLRIRIDRIVSSTFPLLRRLCISFFIFCIIQHNSLYSINIHIMLHKDRLLEYVYFLDHY